MLSLIPGMTPGLGASDAAVVVAFRTALIRQGIVALLIFLLASAVWAGARRGLAPRMAARRAVAWAAEPGRPAGTVSSQVGLLTPADRMTWAGREV